MKNMFIKRVAMVLIITFTFMVFSTDFSFSQNEGIQEELARAKSFYKEKNYEKAQEAVERIISNYGGNKAQYTQELCSAYYLKAKIHFLFEETDMMRDALKEIYKISLHFEIPQNEDDEFLKSPVEEREIVKQEMQPKPEPVLIEINTLFPESVKVCVDKLDLDQAKPFSKNAIELDIKPGKHVFYFISENKCLKEERVVKTSDILDFNLDFSKVSDDHVNLAPGHK